jgi:hypothetical protein
VLQIWARADDRLRRNPPPLGCKRDAAGIALWSICKSRVARIESDCRADRFDARQALAAYGLFISVTTWGGGAPPI